VNAQQTGSEGDFYFERDASGAQLRAGNYQLFVTADQYQSRQSDIFTVGEDQDYDTGDIPLASNPVRFSDTRACVVPPQGGFCNFSVKITNGLSARLSGKAWSIVNGTSIGSFTNFTTFQTDASQGVRLNPGKSSVLRFRFWVRGSVADGATICTTVYVGQGLNALFNTVGQSSLFCIVKGGSGFALLSEQESQAALQQMQSQRPVLPEMLPEKKK
jgi:hypothetical protein